MNRTCLYIAVVSVLAGIIASPVFAEAQNTGEAVQAVANRLVDNQNVDGFWNTEPYYTGSIVPGLVAAYEYACDQSYLAAASMGCEFILYEAQGNYYGDEAYALVKYGQVAGDQYYLNEVYDFYRWIDEDLLGGTEQYVKDYENGTEPSTAVFYVAHHAIASDAVNAADKAVWRKSLRHYLARIDDTAMYPTMALSVATWALAQTGKGLDATPVTPAGEVPVSDYWNGVTLADLPGKIADLQVLRSTNEGAFYEKLVPEANGFESGFTEDSVYAILALTEAENAGIRPVYDISEARARLFDGIEMVSNGSRLLGKVYGHLTTHFENDSYYFYGGKMLQTLPAAAVPADLDGDDVVNISDLAVLASNWLSDSGCQCDRLDLTQDGVVDFSDYAHLIGNFETTK